MPLESIESFVILNPEMPPESLGDKFCRLDINMTVNGMTVNGQSVDLEVQVNNEGDYPDRAVLYWARNFSTALSAGQDYSMLPRTLIISIVDFPLFDCEEYHSFFQLLEVSRHTLLSDKMGLHFYELPKLPSEVSKDHMLLLWLSLFKADTEEELEKIKALEVPVMDQTLNAYYTITAESEFREKERLYAKARHDEAQALRHARLEAKQEGIQEGKRRGVQKKAFAVARNLKGMGMPFDQIVQATGLTLADVEAL